MFIENGVFVSMNTPLIGFLYHEGQGDFYNIFYIVLMLRNPHANIKKYSKHPLVQKTKISHRGNNKVIQ